MPEVLMDYDEVGILIEQSGEAESELTGGRDALADAPQTTRAYLTQFGDILQERPGVVGADLNTDAADPEDVESESGAAVQALAEVGFATDAGQVPDGTHKGRHIDYVITPPGVTAQYPQQVDGGPSDHDGQRVDLTIGRW